jgi:FAD/FMN-containing dehydrogenase
MSVAQGFRCAADEDFVERLRALIGSDALIIEGDDLAYYGSDRCKGGWPVAPGAIALPRTIEQVQAIARLCSENKVAIIPSGGRTGLTGAATAVDGELVVSLERLDQILEVDVPSRLLRCQAGATVQAVQDAATAHGLAYPVDFAAKGTAQIGGSIATNAGGVKVIRHGLTRERVAGLEVVLADGERLSLGGGLVKNNTGYDLRQLFIGSEGTLGLIVEATLTLTQPPPGYAVVLCSLPSDAAVAQLFARLRASSLTLSAFECFDRGCVEQVIAHRGVDQAGPLDELGAMQVLIEVERSVDAASIQDALIELLGEAQEAGELLDAVVAQTGAQAQELWAWREDISESLHAHTPHKADVAVPVRDVARFMTRWREAVAAAVPELPALCFGHVGDGNLHLNLLRPEHLSLDDFLRRCHGFDPIMYGLVREFHGSVSAEHGIGLLKRAYLGHTRSPREIDAMRAIKRIFDPLGILNPGKLFGP